MRRFFAILLIISFVFSSSFIANASFTKDDMNKVVKYYYTQELHNALESHVGADIPVESILQTIDQFANGEFDKAKSSIEEETAKQIAGILLGSTGGTIIGFAWDFAKYSLQSVQEWGRNVDRRLFIKTFLNPEIQQWRASKSVPKWRDLKVRFNMWFNDNQFNLGRTEFFSNKEKWIEQLKFEMWAKTLEVHAKYRRYYLNLKLLQTAAKKKLREIQYLKWHTKYVIGNIVKKLKCANEPVTIENINRVIKDRIYKLAVIKTCALNRAINGNFSVRRYYEMIKVFKGLTAKQLETAINTLGSAYYEPTVNVIRQFFTDKNFRSTVIKKAKNYKKKKNTAVNKKQIENIKEKLMDIPENQLVQVAVEKRTKSWIEKVKKQLNKDEKIIEKQSKIGKEVKVNLGPYRGFLVQIEGKFISKQITYDQYKNFKSFLLSNLNNRIFPYTTYEQRRSFSVFLNNVSKKVEDVRQKAAKDLDTLNKNICEEDKIKQIILQTKHKISKLQKKLTPMKFNLQTLFYKSNNNQLSGGELEKAFEEYEEYLDTISDLQKTLKQEQDRINRLIPIFWKKTIVFKERFENLKNKYLPYEVYYNYGCLNNLQNDIGLLEKESKMLSDSSIGYTEYYDKISQNADFLASQINIYHSLSLLVFEGSKLTIPKEDFTKPEQAYISSMKTIENILRIVYPENLNNPDTTVDKNEIAYIKSRVLKELGGYKNIGYYENLKKQAWGSFNRCNSYFPEENKISKQFSMAKSLARKLRLWPQDLKAAYNGYEKHMDEFFNAIYKSKSACDSDYSDKLKHSDEVLRKLTLLETQIKKGLDNALEEVDAYKTNLYLCYAKLLPILPSFNIAEYENKFNELVKKITYYEPPKVTSIFVNNRRVYQRVYVIYPKPINIKAQYRTLCNKKECSLSSSYIDCGVVRQSCQKLSKEIACTIRSSEPFNSYCYLHLKNVAGNESKNGFFLNHGNFLGNASVFMNRFANEYNNGCKIIPFIKDAPLRDSWLKSCKQNRSSGFTHLNFGQAQLLYFKDFEKDPDFRVYEIKFRIPWQLSGNNQKGGVAVVDLIRKRNIYNTGFYSYIADIQGDNFLSSLNTNTHKTKNNKGTHIAILTHGGNLKNSGYSLNFETGNFKNSEEDLASGFVNPNVKGAEKPYFNVGRLKNMGKVDFNSVKECPSAGYSKYYDYTPANIGHVYCVKTKEGHYAKLQVLDARGVGIKAYIKFKWVYSPNGHF